MNLNSPAIPLLESKQDTDNKFHCLSFQMPMERWFCKKKSLLSNSRLSRCLLIAPKQRLNMQKITKERKFVLHDRNFVAKHFFILDWFGSCSSDEKISYEYCWKSIRGSWRLSCTHLNLQFVEIQCNIQIKFILPGVPCKPQSEGPNETTPTRYQYVTPFRVS